MASVAGISTEAGLNEAFLEKLEEQVRLASAAHSSDHLYKPVSLLRYELIHIVRAGNAHRLSHFCDECYIYFGKFSITCDSLRKRGTDWMYLRRLERVLRSTEGFSKLNWENEASRYYRSIETQNLPIIIGAANAQVEGLFSAVFLDSGLSMDKLGQT